MTVLVTGARGVLGRRLVNQLLSRGHVVRTAGRSGTDVRFDLSDGTGLVEATQGIDAVLHCATDPRRHREVDREGTRRLLQRAHVPVIYPGIVGCDLIPLRYYESKLAAEELVLSHQAGGAVIRATQFHQLIWSALDRLVRIPVVTVPHDTRFQVLDPGVLASRMIDAYEADERGKLDEIGGQFAYGSRDLARSFLAATARRRPVLGVNVPGLVGAAFRAGANLTERRDDTGETWNEFVRRVSTDPAD